MHSLINDSRLKENGIALYTLVKKEVVRFFRIWTQTLLPSVISTALYFLIFGKLIGTRIGTMNGFSYIDYIVPGLIMMSVLTNAYANVVASFFGAKFQRNIEEMLVSPMSIQTLLWGFVLGGTLRGFTVGVLVTGVSVLFTPIQFKHLSFSLLTALLTSILFSLAGLLNGIFAKKFDDINIVPTFVLTPLTYLGGVFYSISLLPVFWQGVSYVNPIFYMVNAFRYGFIGQSDVNIYFAFFIIFFLTLALYFLSLVLLKRGTGIRS